MCWKRFFVFLVFNFCLTGLPLTYGYSGGSGTPGDPYQIQSAGDLLAMAGNTGDYDKAFILTGNISLAGYNFIGAVIAANPDNYYPFAGSSFVGVFDGNGYFITSLTINTNGAGNDYLGLFGYIGTGGVVKNLGVENVNITGGNSSIYNGGLCGENRGTIRNCYSTGQAGGILYRSGGLCGYSSNGDLINCYSTGVVTGNTYSGGLCGYSMSEMTNCYSAGSVTASSYVGGMCGYGRSDYITSSYFLNTAGPDNGYGVALTDSQMKNTASFVGWDFSYSFGDPADWFMPTPGYPVLPRLLLPGDIDADGVRNFRDFAVFAYYWLRQDSTESNHYCDFADMNFDGDVDAVDLYELMEYWLE